MSDVFYPESKKITVAGKEFTIKPYVLRTRTEVLRIFADILLSLSKTNPGLTKEQLLKDAEARNNIILALINTAGDKLTDIYEKTLATDREWLLDNVKIKDEIEIIKAIWEVNDIPFLIEQVTNMVKGLRKTQSLT
jgi:hypothetical protein